MWLTHEIDMKLCACLKDLSHFFPKVKANTVLSTVERY